MKRMMLVILIAFMLISCATSGVKPEPTLAPELPVLEEAMGMIAGKLPTQSHHMVAVLPFTERGIGTTLLGEYVAEKLMMALSATGRVELVERSRLETVYQEQKLGATGLIDDATAASVGNISGAQAAIVGILTNLGECWELTARLLGTSDARVLAMAEARFSAKGVPPNLAGQPIEASSAPLSTQSKGVQQKEPPAPAEPRPVHHPPKVQAIPAHRQPPLHIVFKTCQEITNPRAKRRCFQNLRTFILTGPSTPQKQAAGRCFELSTPPQRIRCLDKVLGEAPQ